MACLLNYSYQMCILVLTDRSGNGVMLKPSLNNRGAEVNLRRAVKCSRTPRLVKCSAPLPFKCQLLTFFQHCIRLLLLIHVVSNFGTE